MVRGGHGRRERRHVGLRLRPRVPPPGRRRPGTRVARLIVGGTFQRAGPIGVHGVAAWNGSWEGLGKGPNGEIRALVAFDSDGGGPAPAALFAGGSFVFGTPSGLATNAALWNGSAWSELGLGLPAPVFAATTFDLDGNPATPPSLIVGGNFGAASWNGVVDSDRRDSRPGSIARDLRRGRRGAAAPSLFAGGILLGSPPTNCPEIRKWTGTTWAPLGAGLGIAPPRSPAAASSRSPCSTTTARAPASRTCSPRATSPSRAAIRR